MHATDGPAPARGRPVPAAPARTGPPGRAAEDRATAAPPAAAPGPVPAHTWSFPSLGRPWAREIALTLLVLALVIAGIVLQPAEHNGNGHVTWFNFALVFPVCSPLLLRVRRPMTVLVLTEVGQFAYLAADGPDGAILLPTLVALYTVASRGKLRRAVWIASAVAVAHTLIRLSVIGHPFLAPENYLGGIWMYLPVAVGHAVRQRRAYDAEVQARLARAEHEREEEARRRVTAERMRIARDLHDVVAHSIAMINIQAGVAAHVIDNDVDQARQALVHIRQASRDALSELRTTLGVLRQDGESDHPTEPTPDAGGVPALVEQYRATGQRARLESDGDVSALPAPVGLALYRIVQESLTNVAKHAGPGATALVRVTHARGVVELTVLDDGQGPAEARDAGGGHGLVGMRERAAAVGGTLEAGPAPGGGFAVRAVLPVGGVPQTEGDV